MEITTDQRADGKKTHEVRRPIARTAALAEICMHGMRESRWN
jgi:hypothetical protein